MAQGLQNDAHGDIVTSIGMGGGGRVERDKEKNTVFLLYSPKAAKSTCSYLQEKGGRIGWQKK